MAMFTRRNFFIEIHSHTLLFPTFYLLIVTTIKSEKFVRVKEGYQTAL